MIAHKLKAFPHLTFPVLSGGENFFDFNVLFFCAMIANRKFFNDFQVINSLWVAEKPGDVLETGVVSIFLRLLAATLLFLFVPATHQQQKVPNYQKKSFGTQRDKICKLSQRKYKFSFHEKFSHKFLLQ